ncbi:hypothetical protein PVV74_00100 [Roseovarius sp. SK2]|uniref:hypothetical protein n=1 Tax=Roseovarius TaxID=74030 RepID=UPI00237AE107|nr:hypothetical protein [Roseovarius sp. SK2]MDD9723844.1 hypothetical protein [Roseovarius sp. SK2]
MRFGQHITVRIARLKDGLFAQLEMISLFVGLVILASWVRDAAVWMGATQRGADITAFCIWVFVFWMGAIWWMYIGYAADMKRAAAGSGKQS